MNEVPCLILPVGPSSARRRAHKEGSLWCSASQLGDGLLWVHLRLAGDTAATGKLLMLDLAE